MNKYTVTYGLVPPQSTNIHESHILPVTKIVQSRSYSNLILTCGRDGTVIKHTEKGGVWQRLRMQTSSDWVSDIVELDHDRFIVVSHDFFVCLVTLNPENDTWTSRMIGYHDDYVKCVAALDKSGSDDWTFATCGLDMKVKIWRLLENGSSTLLHTVDNSQPEGTGSLYAMISIPVGDLPFDLVAGDNNGNLILISSESGGKNCLISSAHDTNIKQLHLMNDGSYIISTSADGVIKLWDTRKLHISGGSEALVHSWKWESPVWCIQGTVFNQFTVGDSRGVITRVSILDDAWDSPQLTTIVSPPQTTTKGILAMLDRGDDKLWYSYSGDSNLHTLDTKTGIVETLKGGYALLKSSLLTNRRQVITQNTESTIQKWDIVSCELLETFDAAMGNFDDMVSSHNTKEILPHWCSVSIKTGKLFVKLSPKFLSTEVYGSALEHYNVVNDIKIEIDERYNLGRIALNSLLNEFISYIIAKDKSFRKELVAKKSSVPGSPSQAPTDSSQSETIRPSFKDKRRLSLFTKLSTNNKQSPTLTSLPNTPLMLEGSSIPTDDSFALPPPATAPQDSDSAKSAKPELPKAPLLAKRSASTGSLLAQKLKLLSTNTSSQASNSSDVGNQTSENKTAPVENVPQTSGEDLEGLKWSTLNNHQNDEKKLIEGNSEHDKDAKVGSDSSEQKQKFLSDFLVKLRDEYIKEFDATTSFKILGRKPPSSKITREDKSPIIEIKAGVLLLVNCWKEGSSGDTVCFSTYLPAPQYDDTGRSDKTRDHQIFDSLESNLPYWTAQALFKDEKTAKDYPKLTFVLKPWQNPDLQHNPEPAHTSEESQTHHNHHHLSFHRHKHNDRNNERKPKPLPIVADAYTKLHAPSMIKVKKILNYVVDRFDTKTPEMKARTPITEWLEIMCKNQLLDNEMALSSVKTLYWKSQGDIILEYRRKANRTD
ncbi:LANO_0C04412g1_1 [Lachancea nothofagi CBS 11611]|uniref:LANO_0C04412g1_1 n=1 Tax=Lachancea nothofagi CBS 11611 TaxID=1266666 RepID=A0A1G4J6U2_9SACH|nr:LANO_0C04412g1_1 [Lachancea nothofagi CBS 11611]